MNYAQIRTLDIANGPGCRVTLFVSGCPHHCKGCFNKVAWDFNYGDIYTNEMTDNIIELLNNGNYNGFSVLGGEPLAPENIGTVKEILKNIKERVTSKAKDSIWVYTGYIFETIPDPSILEYIDVLVDGPFVEELKNLKLQYCGSSNQRVINVKKKLQGLVCFEYDKYNGDFENDL